MQILVSSFLLMVASLVPAYPARLASALRIDPTGELSPRPEPCTGSTPILLQDQKTQAMAPKQKITTFLWFDDDAEEAIRFYLSVFKGSRIVSETRWGEGGPLPKGTLMTATFQLAGQEFMALNGGPAFRFNEAVSLFVSCADQREVDELWEKLGAGGEPGRCGWLKDRFGLSWQIIPSTLGKMLADKDPLKASRVTEAMLGMGKIDIQGLQRAYDRR